MHNLRDNRMRIRGEVLLQRHTHDSAVEEGAIVHVSRPHSFFAFGSAPSTHPAMFLLSTTRATPTHCTGTISLPKPESEVQESSAQPGKLAKPQSPSVSANGVNNSKAGHNNTCWKLDVCAPTATMPLLSRYYQIASQ
eukprot:SAG11_NODE_507_length_8879_cov_8.961048_8_plen_138_part_00